MRHILTAIFSGALIFAFANVSNSKPSPLGTANYVYENADRFDGKSVTIYVRYAKAIMAKKRAQIYVGFGPTDTFPAPNGPFDKLSDEVMAMIQKDYIPFEAVTVDSNGNKHGTIIVLVKKAKAKNFAQNHPAYQDYEPLAIKLEVFCTSWTPVFTDKNIAIAIFPLKNDESCILLAEDFKKEVTNEK